MSASRRAPAPNALIRLAVLAAAVILLPRPVPAAPQDGSGETAGMRRTAETADRDLAASLKELADLRERIAAEKLPLNRELRKLESRLVELRDESQDVSRLLDTRNLDMTNLRKDLSARNEEKTYLSNLLDEYIRNLETRVHITELQRYRDELERARLAPEDETLDPAGVFQVQTGTVEMSLDRLLELVGGESFDGKAVGEDGTLQDVRFALVGPVALYSAADGSGAGLAEQRLGSLEPNMSPLKDRPELTAQIRDLVTRGQGTLPLDPTLGNAQKIEETRETWSEHIMKGGPVMVPILAMASAALLVAFLKWIQIARIRTPSRRRVENLMQVVQKQDWETARKIAAGLPGPGGEMLRAGLEHVHEPKELVEEIMFERMLETRLRLQSFLPFISLSASAAPLLGLLGTVTGMINTFKLITVFGSGDAKTLSSGISEALITTEFGLIVAIPSLLLYAFLARKAKRFVDGMEKTAVSFLNRIPSGEPIMPARPQADAVPPRSGGLPAGAPVPETP